MSPRPDRLTLSAHRDSTMARMFDDFDWASHPFGTPDTWPRGLLGAFTLLIDAAFPAAMWLGPDLNLFYNDAYVSSLGPRHPAAFGKPGREVWGELWPVIGPQFAEVMATRQGISLRSQRLIMTRHGYEEETFWDYTISPLTDEQGQVAGILNEAYDASDREFQARNYRAIIELDNALIAADDADTILATALRTIGEALGADRAGYGEVDASGRWLDVPYCWARGDLPPVTGRHAIGEFGVTEDLAAGRTVAIADPRLDPRTSSPEVMALIEHGGIGAGVLVPVLDRGRYAAEVFVHSSTTRDWRPHEVAFAEQATQRLHQALVRARAENRLRDSEERYRLIFEQANDIIFTADLDQTITDANEAGARALGIPREQIIGSNIADYVNAADLAQTTSMLRKKIEHGGHTRHEVGINRPDGTTVRWENDSTLVVDRDGSPMGLLSISRDVTEQRAFEDRRELLIHELNHRVKNTLSLVQALANQSFRGREAEADGFISRITALAAAHDLLTRENWEGVTLSDVVTKAVSVFASRHVTVEGGPRVGLRPKQAIAITMALHELATNATKYGALSRDGGEVTIKWSDGDGRFRLSWVESGGPPVKVPENKGFGLRMIERALASDLSGSVTMDFEESGLSCTIDAPLPGGGH